MGSVPPAEAGIPVIDISSQNANAAKQLLDAAANYGFVFIENNEVGISYDAIANMFDLSRGFFALPVELKQEVAINSAEANKNHGWLSRGVEKLDPATQKAPDVKECVSHQLKVLLDWLLTRQSAQHRRASQWRVATTYAGLTTAFYSDSH